MADPEDRVDLDGWKKDHRPRFFWATFPEGGAYCPPLPRPTLIIEQDGKRTCWDPAVERAWTLETVERFRGPARILGEALPPEVEAPTP